MCSLHTEQHFVNYLSSLEPVLSCQVDSKLSGVRENYIIFSLFFHIEALLRVQSSSITEPLLTFMRCVDSLSSILSLVKGTHHSVPIGSCEVNGIMDELMFYIFMKCCSILISSFLEIM